MKKLVIIPIAIIFTASTTLLASDTAAMDQQQMRIQPYPYPVVPQQDFSTIKNQEISRLQTMLQCVQDSSDMKSFRDCHMKNRPQMPNRGDRNASQMRNNGIAPINAQPIQQKAN